MPFQTLTFAAIMIALATSHAGLAHAQTAEASKPVVAKPTMAGMRAPGAIKAPPDWISYEAVNTATAADVRKATSFLRLEAGRTSGDARRGLLEAAADLDAFAASLESGAPRMNAS